MSQLGFHTSTKQLVPVTTDVFGVITVQSGTLSSFKIGEKITGGTSGATARISGIISAIEIRVKGIKGKSDTGALFANGETITGASSSNTAVLAASGGFTLQKKQLRYDNSLPTLSTGNVTFNTNGNVTFATANSTYATGMIKGAQFVATSVGTANNLKVYTVTSVTSGTVVVVTPVPGTTEGPQATVIKGLRYQMTYDAAAADDRGFGLKRRWMPANNTWPEVVTAVRKMQSKSQNTDTSVAPTLTYNGPVTATYSKAASPTIRFQIRSNEMLTVAGTPVISFSFNAAGTQILAAGITSITGAAGVATVVTTAATGYKVNDQVAVAGMTTAGFNNATAVVTSVSADTKTFTYANATTGACTIGTGTITFNALQYAYFNAAASGLGPDRENLYFDYVLGAPAATGTLSATTGYVANSATITDIGGGTITPAPNGVWSPATTGVTVGA